MIQNNSITEIQSPEDIITSIQFPSSKQSLFIDYNGGLLAKDSNGNITGDLYYFGIIDILLEYTAKKKIANFCKTIAAGSQDGLSSVPSDFYCQRFNKFIQDHTD